MWTHVGHVFVSRSGPRGARSAQEERDVGPMYWEYIKVIPCGGGSGRACLKRVNYGLFLIIELFCFHALCVCFYEKHITLHYVS